MHRLCVDCETSLGASAKRRCAGCKKLHDRRQRRKYYVEHPERFKAASKRWKKENPDRCRSHQQRFKERNPDYHPNYQRTYYQENKETIAARHRAWWQKKRATAKHLPKQPPLEWPFLQNANGEYEVLRAISERLPRGIDRSLRDDVGNEIWLALWEKKITLAELENPALIRRFVGLARRMNCEASGEAVSIDQPGRDGRTLHERLAADEVEDELEGA